MSMDTPCSRQKVIDYFMERMNSKMKKVLAICLMMVMVVSMSATAFAAPNGFVSSPSGNAAPTVVGFDPSDDDCTANLVITPYGDKHELPDALRTLFEKAYNDIVNTKNLTTLNEALAKLAASKNIDGTKLAVSDLFDIHVTGCAYHEGHADFDVTLDADTLSHFVALLHMNQKGEWELVTDAEVVNNGEHLKFSVDAFSPFAVVVDTTTGSGDAPQTGDNSMIHIYAIVMAVSALAFVFVLVKSKKQSV